MICRMGEYRFMLQRRYKIPVRQHVLYVGMRAPKMVNVLDEEDLFFRFHLTSLNQVDYRLLLNSDKPEEKILTILANFGNDPEEVAFGTDTGRGNKNGAGRFAQSRYFKQLRILVQLRKLEIKFFDAMESISKYFSEEKDVLYKKGGKKVKRRAERRE